MGLSLLAAGHSLGRPGIDASYRSWAKGPVRWLMLSEEERAFRKLRSDRQAAHFVEEFWRRRDPDLEAEGNPFADRFWERVEAADRLYPEGRDRGSLTDRGRALVLLGSPSVVRVSQQTSPAWDPRRSARNPEFAVQQVTVEIWEFGPDDLWPKMLDLLRAEEGASTLSLTFVLDGRRARLTEGERFLELAARASVRSTG